MRVEKHYNFETTPMKLILQIISTGDSSILNVENHEEVADYLIEEYKKVFPDNQNNFISNYAKIDALELKKTIVLLAVEGLKFNKEGKLLEILETYGYQVNDKFYFQSLDKIKKQVKNIDIEISHIKNQLPKKNDTDIDEIILSYCSIAGITYDTNKITTKQFKALESICQAKAQ